MKTLLDAIIWLCVGVGVILLLWALVRPSAPKTPVFVLAGIAELGVIVGVIASIVGLIRGHQSPELVTHLSYLFTEPFVIPVGVAMTYKKIDRWGLVIIAVACLFTSTLVLRQWQTYGVM